MTRPIVILGSGMAGLGASYRLRQEGLSPILFDAKSHAGGHTASHASETGFVFDEGPHISFTKDPRIQALFAANVGGDFQTIRARVNNYWKGHWVKHPAQCNLHGLPTDLVVKAITGIIDAHYRPPGEVGNYEEWLIASYGRPFAETFPMQYTRKYHTTEAANLSTDWLGPRLYRPSLEEVLAGALSAVTPEVHYIDEFRYPTEGGFVSFLRPFLRGSEVRLNHTLIRLDPAARTASFGNGVTVEYEHLISSVPLPELVRTIVGAPAHVRAAAERLACSTCVIVNVGVDRAALSEWHWTYFYDDDFCFSRVSFPHMFSPRNAPAGAGSVQAELYYSTKYKPLDRRPADCIESTIRDLTRCGILRSSDRILFTDALVVPYANIIFDLERAEALATVGAYLEAIGVHRCGRYGLWGYQWTDESFISGEHAAGQVLEALTLAKG